MDTQSATQNFSKFANNVQVGPLSVGGLNAPQTTGPVFYIGGNQDNSIITDSDTDNALDNINIQNPLADFSLYVAGPPLGPNTSLILSMSDLYYGAIADAIDQGADLTNGVSISFKVMDVVSNGSIGKMIVFGSQLLPLVPDDSGDNSNNSDGGQTGD